MSGYLPDCRTEAGDVASYGHGYRCQRCGNAIDNPLGLVRPPKQEQHTSEGQRLCQMMGYVWEGLSPKGQARWEARAAQRINPTAIDTPERPIEVGDYVRWERGPSAPLNWAEGEVVELSSNSVKVRIYAQYSKRLARVGELCWLGTEQHMGCTLRRIPRPVAHTVNPLEVKHDGVVLGALLIADRLQRHDQRDLVPLSRVPLTPAQRAAVSAHWSAELSAKVAASDAQRKAREVSVLCQGDYDDDEPWGPR